MRATRNKQVGTMVPAEHPSAETVTGQPRLNGEAGGGSAASGCTKTAPERARGQPAERPAGWDVFLELLRGLGLLSTQLNDYRLYLPVELRRRLGDLLELPWVISYWCEGCLRAVPQYLWTNYVERLRQETERLGHSDLVDEAVVQPASVIHLEHGGRWHLPHSLAELGKIDGGSLCLLCSGDGGIEIWDAAVKQERLRAIVGKLDHKLVALSRPSQFSGFQPPRPPTRSDTSIDPTRVLQQEGRLP